MAENDIRPQSDALTGVSADEQNVEYEYVELEEGQELPDGYEYEYEYVEVPADDGEGPSELDVLGAHRTDAATEAAAAPRVLSASEENERAGEDVPTFNRSVAPAVRSDEPEMKFMNEDFVAGDASANEYREFVSPASSPLLEAEQGRPKDKALSDYIFADDEDEETEEAETVQTTEAAAEVEPFSADKTAASEDMSIEAATGEMSIDEMLGEVHEPQIDVSVLDDNFGLEPTAGEAEPSVIENAATEIAGAAEEIPETTITEEAASAEEPRTEAIPQQEEGEVRYQNQDITDGAETENWFQKNELDGAYDPADVHVEYLGENFNSAEESGGDVEAYLEPGAVVSPAEAAVSEADVLTVSEGVENETLPETLVEEVSDTVPADSYSAAEPVEDVVDLGEDVEYAEPTEIIEDFGENGIYEPRINETVEEVAAEPQAVLPEETAAGALEENVPVSAKVEESVAENANVDVVIPEPAAESEDAVSETLSAEKIEDAEAVIAARAAVESDDVIRGETAERLIPVEDFAEISVADCSAAEYEQAGSEGKTVTKNDGVQSFRGTIEQSSIVLSEIDFANNELSAWNLVLFSRELMPLTSKVSEVDMPLCNGISRFVTLVRNGRQKAEFFNEETLRIINATEACVAVEGRFVCGDLGTNSGVIIDDYKTIPLADFAGKKVSFAKPSSGLLAGPKGSLLYFFNVKQILLPDAETAKIDAEKLQYKISKWYSGSLNDKYFEFDANSASAEFTGNDEVKAIHVNVNNSSYGWNVAFDNGLSMNLRDLREFQTRFGKMPSPNGVITYGEKKLTFSNVERIVVYESAQYFFYS